MVGSITDQVESLSRQEFREIKTELRTLPAFVDLVTAAHAVSAGDKLRIRRVFFQHHIMVKSTELSEAATAVLGMAR